MFKYFLLSISLLNANSVFSIFSTIKPEDRHLIESIIKNFCNRDRLIFDTALKAEDTTLEKFIKSYKNNGKKPAASWQKLEPS